MTTSETDGIRLTALLSNGSSGWEKFPIGAAFNNPPKFRWNTWSTPTYKERLKGSYPLIQKYFELIP